MDLCRHFVEHERHHLVRDTGCSSPGAAAGRGAGRDRNGGSMESTVALLRRSARPDGMLLIGEPYWRRTRGDEVVASFGSPDEWSDLRRLVTRFGELAATTEPDRVRVDRPPRRCVENEVVVISNRFDSPQTRSRRVRRPDYNAFSNQWWL
jgi:hypothetical protein